MIIRTTEEVLHGWPPEDTFVAYDDMENRLGEAAVVTKRLDALCPERPMEMKIETECKPEALPALLGAGVARAYQLAKKSGFPSRLYAECAPEDEARMALLSVLGLVPGDGLLLMRQNVEKGPASAPAPANCVLVSDELTDEREQAYFLERWASLYGESVQQAANWLAEAMGKRFFKRFVFAERGGLVGEIVAWTQGREGVVGHVYTAPAWRNKGVATCLFDLTRRYFAEHGVNTARVCVRQRYPGALRAASNGGYRMERMLVCYPGTDI